MKYKYFIYLVIFFISTGMFSQKYPSNKELKKISKQYSKELKLPKVTSEKFNELLFYYNDKLIAVDSTNKSYDAEVNKIVKLFDLEVYKLLSNEEFEEYKKVKLIIEPYKKYRL